MVYLEYLNLVCNLAVRYFLLNIFHNIRKIWKIRLNQFTVISLLLNWSVVFKEE